MELFTNEVEINYASWNIYFLIKSLIKMNVYSTVVGENINIMKTTFDLNFDFIKLLNSMDTHKNGNKEKLSIKKVFL